MHGQTIRSHVFDPVSGIIINIMNPAIFLDRDGVLNENRADYVKTLDELVLIEPAIAAMPQLRDTAFKIILVTNQSAVGRHIIGYERADAINNALCRAITDRGGRIDDVYMCVHHPYAGCACRKPQPGMLLDAAATHEIDLSRSYFVGDALTDYEAGVAAGVTPLMVRTGRGVAQLALMAERGYQARTFDNLSGAIEWILKHETRIN